MQVPYVASRYYCFITEVKKSKTIVTWFLVPSVTIHVFVHMYDEALTST